MIVNLDHVGIAVSDPTALTRLFQILGLKINSTEKVEDQGVLAHFMPCGQTTPASIPKLELLEPLGDQSPIAKFLGKRGPGVHHLSFKVKKGSLVAVCQKLRAEKYQLLYETPRDGAHGHLINFIHPSSAGGILIELMESKE